MLADLYLNTLSVGLMEYSSCGLAILALDASLGMKINVTVIDSSFGHVSIHCMEYGERNCYNTLLKKL